MSFPSHGCDPSRLFQYVVRRVIGGYRADNDDLLTIGKSPKGGPSAAGRMEKAIVNNRVLVAAFVVQSLEFHFVAILIILQRLWL